MRKIDCKAMADQILDDVAAKMQAVEKPKSLLILYGGDDPASAAYMRGKVKDCERVGIPCEVRKADTEQDLLWDIDFANRAERIGGIIVQLPLPEGWDEERAVNAVSIEKDVDGFQVGSHFKPCTPEAIMHILHHELGEDLAGKGMLLIGKGKLVGRPLIPMLLDEGATLMIAHSKTHDVSEITRGVQFNAVISATGKRILRGPDILGTDTVVDAGIHRGEDGKLHGDIEWDGAEGWFDRGSYTSVPGGVGLLTRAMLMKHMGEVQG